ncbi:carbon-nitrogen hydrolase family protein [Parahaliea aestuarii]|uniref:Carbon-nitrogen hydrolase family protein n=1 Tax=Parahaliea aestuarii TaxID=1852021 RepID=A0A5C9A2Z6_9GAMM|nr:carbon-nitrogen hydrolase family protein [Parahaliea aestuarii]TXS94374.1 carbon-nitrogen hydrolase family protein [Parahaliea aestuarii]
MSRFAIAGLQLQLSSKDNRYLIEKHIRRLALRFPWVQMVVLGELATHGADPAAATELPGDIVPFYAALARETGLWLVPGSIYEKDEHRVYNTALVFNPAGELVTSYRKMFPFCPYEREVWAGDEFCTFDVPGAGRFGLSICYDQWFPETSRNLAWLGAEVILCPTMTNTIDRELELCLARANAISNQCYFFNVNVAGELGNGRSITIGPDGQVLHQAGELNEIMPVEVDFEHLRRVRERGVFGLCQTLKSFRDSEMEFPAFQLPQRGQGPLAELGELGMPRREDNTKLD